MYAHSVRRFLALPAAMAVTVAAFADIETGIRDVVLDSDLGDDIVIGQLAIETAGDQFTFDFQLDESQFSDQFLSMRPFKCLDGDPMVCHLAYPYATAGRIRADDLVDLEYEFLFIVRAPGEYGIDPYNGRYYRLENIGGELTGSIQAVDLNILAAPPDEGNMRPITDVDLEPLESDTERFPRLVISAP
jgi:hypothetical protein